MVYTYDQLSKMTAAELRAIATGLEREELRGVSTMHKEKLLPLLCRALGVEIPHHRVVGVDKTSIKQKIRALKRQRDEAIRMKKREELERIRDEIHRLRRELRKHLV
jgi:protein-arginine kinase activator protein McsA